MSTTVFVPRVQISLPGRLVVVPLVFELISGSWPDHVLRMWLETNRNSLFPKLWFHSRSGKTLLCEVKASTNISPQSARKIPLLMENYPVVSLVPPLLHRHLLHGRPLPVSLPLALLLLLPLSELFVLLLLLFHHQPGNFLPEIKTSTIFCYQATQPMCCMFICAS